MPLAGEEKNAISPFFDGSRNKNIGDTIRIGREIWCLPYAGFILSKLKQKSISKSFFGLDSIPSHHFLKNQNSNTRVPISAYVCPAAELRSSASAPRSTIGPHRSAAGHENTLHCSYDHNDMKLRHSYHYNNITCSGQNGVVL